MFAKTVNYKAPTGAVTKIEINPCSLGGGFVIKVSTEDGREDYAAFTDEGQLLNYLIRTLAPKDMLNKEPPKPASSEPVPEKTNARLGLKAKSPGRPKLTEEQKAAKKAERAAKKANGALPETVSAQDVPTQAEVQKAA
jgi:hypothetical protein